MVPNCTSQEVQMTQLLSWLPAEMNQSEAFATCLLCEKTVSCLVTRVTNTKQWCFSAAMGAQGI